MRLVSQLIKGTSRVLEKLLKYFNCTTISRFFLPSSSTTPVIILLYLNYALLSTA